MAKVDTVTADLLSIKGTLDNVAQDTSALLLKVNELEQKLADEDMPQEIVDLVAEIKQRAETIDAAVQTPGTTPDPEEPPEESEDPAAPNEPAEN